MGAVHKISEDFYEDAFTLIAIHSSLDDYAMVYAINQNLKAYFKRSPKDLDITEDISFPYFEWKDEVNDRYWALMANTSVKEQFAVGENLFLNEPSYSTSHLIPEYKEVDYFLKIEQDDIEALEEVVKKLFELPKVVAAYVVATNGLKSKINLIF